MKSRLTATPRYKTCCQLWHRRPWHLDPGNPCRDDGVTQTLVYNDERGAWERCEHLQFGYLRKESLIAGVLASPAGASKACTPHFNLPYGAAS